MYVLIGSFLLFIFVLIFVLFFLLVRPCLIILFGDKSLLLTCNFLSKTLVFSKKRIILFVDPLMCFANS